MEENETMTVREVISVTMKLLGEIQVPVAFIRQIGIPINDAINNLQMCINAYEEADNEKRQELVIEDVTVTEDAGNGNDYAE